MITNQQLSFAVQRFAMSSLFVEFLDKIGENHFRIGRSDEHDLLIMSSTVGDEEVSIAARVSDLLQSDSVRWGWGKTIRGEVH